MKKNTLISLTASILLLGVFIFYLKRKKPEYLVSYGYGFKNEKYLSQLKGEVGDFGLLDHKGVFHSLYRDSDADAVIIISQDNKCPMAKDKILALEKIKSSYKRNHVSFYFLNSNPSDSRSSIIEEDKKYQIELPILMDSSQVVANHLGMKKISEAVVIDPKNWKILYRGEIGEHLEEVIKAAVTKQSLHIDKVTDSNGCLISYEKPKSLSYEKTIAPIIINKCMSCHTESVGYLPYFDNYEKVKGWGAMSKETIFTDRMPPWSADPLYGSYVNDLSLTPEEKRSLVKWIDLGAPRDGISDPLIQASEKLKEKKEIFKKLKPIYSISYTEKNIPPGGLIEYRYVQLGERAPYDMWVTGLQTLSSNPRQLHHETLMITSKPLKFYESLIDKYADINEETRKKNVDGDVTMFVLGTINQYERYFAPENYLRFQAWGGGHLQPTFMDKQGLMIFVPKNSYLILESHYMGTGIVDNEKSTFEFYGFREKPKGLRQIRSVYTTNFNFEIPPNTKDYVVTTPEWIPEQDIHIREFNGHLHMRGISVKIEMTTKDGKTQTLASIPNYNYGWGVGTYMELKEPIAVKAGSRFRTICHYDNTANNPYNPDPDKKIHFGQRVDRSEMCIMHVRYTNDAELRAEK